MDPSGILYGTTQNNGINQGGTVFELTPTGGKRWKYRVLYPFCTLASCADGSVSKAGLIADTAGNLYGTTSQGGQFSKGTAFELMPNANRTKWKFKLLHAFCSAGGTSCTDGSIPLSGLTYAGAASGTPYDGTSALYGTTVDGGRASPGSGVVYQLVPNGGGANETVLYRFCPKSPCSGGASPEAGVTVDGAGDLYGTTAVGGKNGLGTVFELSPRCRQLERNRSAQLLPEAELPRRRRAAERDGDGRARQSLRRGRAAARRGDGVAFKLVPSGKTSKETVLHNSA